MDTNANTHWKRSKRIALLLAIFLGPFTWLYTYRRDPGKATVGLGSLSVDVAFLTPISMALFQFYQSPPSESMANESIGYVLVGLIMLLPFILAPWYLAIIITAIEKQWCLDRPEERSKIQAILYAAFLGPWTWLYTYKKDYWRFWSAMFIGLGGLAAWILLLREVPSVKSWLLIWLVIWIGALVNAILRKSEWYRTYGT